MTNFQDIHLEQGLAAFDRGHFGESIEHFRKAVARQPDDPHLRFNLALALDGNGDIQSAGVEYREAVRLSPAEAGLHYGLGTHFLKAEQWDQAIASFHQAAQLQLGYPDALRGTAFALQRKAQASGQTSHYSAYLDAVGQMISLFPEQSAWRRNRAWALWKMDRCSEAVAEMEELLSLEPTSRNYSRVLYYQRRLGRWRDFMQTWRAMWRYEYRRYWRRQPW